MLILTHWSTVSGCSSAHLSAPHVPSLCFSLENRSGPPLSSSQGSKVKSIQPALSICSCCDKAIRSLPVHGTNVQRSVPGLHLMAGVWPGHQLPLTSGCFYTPPPAPACKSERSCRPVQRHGDKRGSDWSADGADMFYELLSWGTNQHVKVKIWGLFFLCFSSGKILIDIKARKDFSLNPKRQASNKAKNHPQQWINHSAVAD